MDFFTLDWQGALVALVLGVAVLLLGLELGYFFLASLLVFLVLSTIVTHTGLKYKKALNLSQKLRGVKNVLANGLPPFIFVVMFYLFSRAGNTLWALLASLGFLASVAAITSDKFSSEIGVLNGKPTMLFTLRKVRKGTSGAVTWLGLAAGLVGAFLIALLVFFTGMHGAFSNNLTILAEIALVVGL